MSFQVSSHPDGYTIRLDAGDTIVETRSLADVHTALAHYVGRRHTTARCPLCAEILRRQPASAVVAEPCGVGGAMSTEPLLPHALHFLVLRGALGLPGERDCFVPLCQTMVQELHGSQRRDLVTCPQCQAALADYREPVAR